MWRSVQRNIPFLKSNSILELLLACYFVMSGVVGHAQNKPAKENAPDPKDVPVPTNIRVIDERKDKDGTIIRTIQYEQGGKRIKETLIVRNHIDLHVPINPDTMDKDKVLVLVSKSRFVLELFYRGKMIRSYKAVFGPKPMEDKKMEGDRATPEGWFTIRNKNPNSKYDKFMLLNYPNDTSISRFNALKEKGAIPKTAKIGGDVGIHGIWKGGDDLIENGICWTDGCVAVKNKDIEELYKFVGVGTKVYIRK